MNAGSLRKCCFPAPQHHQFVSWSHYLHRKPLFSPKLFAIREAPKNFFCHSRKCCMAHHLFLSWSFYTHYLTVQKFCKQLLPHFCFSPALCRRAIILSLHREAWWECWWHQAWDFRQVTPKRVLGVLWLCHIINKGRPKECMGTTLVLHQGKGMPFTDYMPKAATTEPCLKSRQTNF